MKFEANRVYLDREGNEYTYVEQRGGILVFKDATSGNLVAQNPEDAIAGIALTIRVIW